MMDEAEKRRREIRLTYINQMLAELDKEIRARFGDISPNPVHKAKIARFKQCCRGTIALKDIPEDERKEVRRLRQEWIKTGRNEVWLLMQSRFLLLTEGIHQRNEDDPEGEWLERDAMISYLDDLERKYGALIRQAEGAVEVEETPKMKRLREKQAAFARMAKVIEDAGKSGIMLSELDAAEKVWLQASRLFKNAKSLRAEYNRWKNDKARSSRARG